MVDDYETTWTFRKPQHFWVELNRKMVIKDRDTLNNGGLYHLLFFTNTPQDFNELIGDGGYLEDDSRQIKTGYTDETFHLGVEWLDNGENGFSLHLDEIGSNDEQLDVNIMIDDDTTLYIGGVALAKETGEGEYIVAFARMSTPVQCQNAITLMGGSSFVGHSSCKEAN